MKATYSFPTRAELAAYAAKKGHQVMAYTEVYTVIDGALDDELYIDESGLVQGMREFSFDEWLKGLRATAEHDGFTVDVFEIEHGHDQDAQECSCVQYLTDHHPSYTFGPGEE